MGARTAAVTPAAAAPGLAPAPVAPDDVNHESNSDVAAEAAAAKEVSPPPPPRWSWPGALAARSEASLLVMRAYVRVEQ